MRIRFFILLALVFTAANAQVVQADSSSIVQRVVKYGYCNSQQLLERHPAYESVVLQMQSLRKQYENEVQKNETDFRRLFAEYLNGQKEFPKPILLKRQRDLQDAMEKGIAFRNEADSLIKAAETELMAPLKHSVEAAVRVVAEERGYEYVVDTAQGQYLYLSPALSEDITAFVEEQIKRTSQK